MGERQRIDTLFKLIGKGIAKERKKKSMSQEILATSSGLSRSSIVLIEQGRQRVPIDRLYRIAKSLDCNIDIFLPAITEVFPDRQNSEEPPIDNVSKNRLVEIGVYDQVKEVLVGLEEKNHE